MSFDGVDDVLKIKPVVELKEDHGNHVYKADFRGHLQLVNVDDDIMPNQLNVEENILADPLEQYAVSPQSSDEDQQLIVPWQDESISACLDNEYGECKATINTSKIFVKEELLENEAESCSYVHSIPEIYEYSSDSTWETPVDDSNNAVQSNDLSSNGDLVILTQAEKKRMYRLKIKEENPAMWTSIKEREAARKRELREKRRQVIFEMQKAMEMASQPTFAEEQQMYLEALKDRYPDIWNQLMKALPETERRNQQLFIERTTKSIRTHGPKPVKMYKDVIEAQKKRLYRQRLKEQRPEMYERQKARDAYARSVQRMLAKANTPSSKMGYYTERHFSDDMEMCHPQLNIYQDKEFLASMHSKDDIGSDCSLTAQEVLRPSLLYSALSSPSPITEASLNSDLLSDGSKSNSSNACDNEHLKNGNNCKPTSNSCDNKEPSDQSAASTTQSNVLWYWNDVKVNSMPDDNSEALTEAPYWPIRQGPTVLSEDERLEKAEKERLYLKEKRRRYRLSMTPEKRTEFLRRERERLKQYRIKKKKGDDT